MNLDLWDLGGLDKKGPGRWGSKCEEHKEGCASQELS